jgi:hypothetical protein
MSWFRATAYANRHSFNADTYTMRHSPGQTPFPSSAVCQMVLKVFGHWTGLVDTAICALPAAGHQVVRGGHGWSTHPALNSGPC